ncbi:MAG: TetR/AcrR family transcriptional regulator [Herminiimonas sp.]|nr:TetR/AcrR family transcriptional regulator [Herminiimonas sp.]
MPDCPFKNAKPRWARRKTARPQELLAAALDLFVERGFAATRLEDVAALAGVSKGTLYLYFANKEELFKAVVRENVVPVIGEAESVIDSFQGPSIDLFRDIMLGWWQRIGDTKLSGISKLIMAESGNFPEVARFYHEEVMSRAQRMIVRMLERGMARGEFRALDAAQATQIVMAPMLVLMMWKHTFQVCSPDTFSPHSYVQSVIDLLLNGLATRFTQPVP